MRWIRYEADGHPVYGILDGDIVTEVRGDPFAGYVKTTTRRPLSSVKLLVPVEPRTFYCAGLNYADHVIEAAKKRGQEPNLPTAADIGYRANNALVAHGEPIVIPSDATERVQYEGELVAVIGKKAKHLSESEALSCVLGWTIGNDMSERTWQAGDRTLWRAKNTDTFKPMGPWIETDFDLTKPLHLVVRKNGDVTQEDTTASMIFSFADIIAYTTSFMTLKAGDIICTGTPVKKTAKSDPPVWLKPGDTIEVESPEIGVLRNSVVDEA